jgi:hypothetical protein
MEGRLRVHPAVLIPGVVILSQVGPVALLLSGPILSFGSDLVRYIHGRLAEPARPAGLLPGDALPVAAGVAGATRRPVPSVYRGRRATVPGRISPTTTTTARPVTGPAPSTAR